MLWQMVHVSREKLWFLYYYPSLYFLDTSLTKNHGIFSAFLYAYNSHEDIVLSPDDIWLMICMYFSKYVTDNAEQLRSLFVDHEGKKKLTVVQIGDSKPEWVDTLFDKDCKYIDNVLVGTIFLKICEWK